MDVGAQSYSNVIVVSPSGRVDHQSADQLGAAMAPHLARCERAQCKLVLDLSGVEYMSSAGLRVLMVAGKQARAQGGMMVVSGLGETLREIFQISRFDRVFTVYDDVREAIAGLEPDALAEYERGAPSSAPRC